MSLAAGESLFLVFKEPMATDAMGSKSSNTPEFADVATLNGPWTVGFDGQGAPKEIVFDALTDWSKHPEESIRQFSGTGLYETKFTLANSHNEQQTILSLGAVFDIATVMVNGKEAGTIWTNPWEVDISRWVKPGENTLQIKVANSWHNRLVADAALPPERRLSYASIPYSVPKGKPLKSSGLLGPVKIKQSMLTR
jgi:hypothetical protein